MGSSSEVSIALSEFYKLPEVASYFPVKVGEFTWTQIIGKCHVCKNDIDPYLLRGTVSPVHSNVSYRDFGEIVSYEFSAYGVCLVCAVATSFKYMLHNDGTLTGETRDGTRGTWVARKEPTSFLDRLRDWVSNRHKSG